MLYDYQNHIILADGQNVKRGHYHHLPLSFNSKEKIKRALKSLKFVLQYFIMDNEHLYFNDILIEFKALKFFPMSILSAIPF